MKYTLADGDAYVQGRSPEKSKELLEAAVAAGIDPALVRTTSDGYFVPKELGGDEGDENHVVEIGIGVPEAAYQDTVIPEAPAEAPAEDGGEDQEQRLETDAFDPGEHTVGEVKEYLDGADDAERERVLSAEAEGKARKSLLPEEEGK